MHYCVQEGIVKLADENFSVSLVKGRQLLLRLSQYLILDPFFLYLPPWSKLLNSGENKIELLLEVQ